MINEEIREKEVRVVGNDGSQLGFMSSKEAYQKAMEQDLDLVLIAPNAKPPVCKIMDYGKFCFEQAKREKEAKKKQKVVEIKEIRIVGLNIDTHDLEIKANNARKFVKSGDKVKVTIRFRGRELGHLDFERPRDDLFRGLPLAISAARTGGSMPCVFNAANEWANARFRKGGIRFTEIYDIIEAAMAAHQVIRDPSVDDILQIEEEIDRRLDETFQES